VLTNNHLIDSGYVKSIFTQYSYQSSDYNFAYRPLCIFSFYIENLIFGKSPLVSHLINLILYVFLNIILFLLLFKISKNLFTSLLIILLFASFPLHTEVIDNIKNRDEIFVSISGFLALYYAIYSIKYNKKYYLILVFIFSLLGILFKESFLIFPVIIASSVLLFYTKPGTFNKFYIFIKYFLISGSAILISIFIKHYFLYRSTVNREFEFFENPLFFSTIWERILPSIYIIGYYISLLLNPFKLSYYYGYNTINYNDYLSLNFILGVLFIISIPILIYKNKKNRLLNIGIILLIVNLLSISNFIKPLVGIVAERFLFNGSLGFCIILYLFLGYALNYFIKSDLKKKIFLIVFAILITAYSIRTFTRNPIWKNELSLYSHDIKNVPNSAKANEMLAGNYYKRYFTDKTLNSLILSEKYYLKSIEIYPEHPACLNNLGTINFIKRDYQNAIKYYQKTLLFKDKPLTHYNLAQCYYNIGDIPSAKKEYEIALLKNPDIHDIFSNYKSFIISNNLIAESINFIEREMVIKHSNNLNIYLLLIDFYNEQNNYKEMVKYLKIANKIKPTKEYSNYINQLENYLKNNLGNPNS